MNDDCETMRDKITDHLFDCLSAPDRDALNEHLGRCPKCAEYLQALRDESALLRELAQKVGAGMQVRKERMAEAIKSCDSSERTALMAGAQESDVPRHPGAKLEPKIQ